MTWVKLDDGYPEHPKLVEAGPHALVLDIRGMAYSARRLTDGIVPAGALPALMADLDPGALDALLRVGRWRKTRAGYEIRGFLEHNPSRQQVLAARRQRQEAARLGGRARAQTARRKQDGSFTPAETPAGSPGDSPGDQPDRLADPIQPGRQPGSQRGGMGTGMGMGQMASKGKNITIPEMADQLQGVADADLWWFREEFERRGAAPPDIEKAVAIARSNGGGAAGEDGGVPF